ncbi:MAG TPA: bifunctional diaminohydroxyphosphoribosylaminopyrimidine deaminase/5-amino-6-(5-phosphoribosylamino)uracil reductase RibD [bacterium]|jgi:diaminohydroxyphosphoribosylaminopyrimidine deaminase/5-amino-6-(5-phosphoribosylamino)uracil reductase|nr:bifunctional diaminohydroxyphosphoribosylaminopyrimidine deaminase/5-amino-6-(5-phosphoribosylamino)uracil reductase RibD [bacterium]
MTQAHLSADERFMRLALNEARKGEFRTWPNPWVGAVLVKAGKVVGRGWHRGAGLPHAEAEALRAAGNKAKGSTLYVTLEPCAHYGRTPPCAIALVEAGVKRVVAACPDLHAQAAGGLDYLRAHKVEVAPFTLREEAEGLNRFFLHSVGKGRPWFTLKAAASLDGRTATSKGESRWITSPGARADARALRGCCDAVLVGAGTVLKDEPTLMPEDKGSFVPWRLILDPRGRLKGTEGVFKDEFAPRTVWFAGVSSFKQALEASRHGGSQVQPLHSGGLTGAVQSALEWMRGRDLRRVMVEGGAETLGSFLSLGLGEELFLYLAPKLEGSGLGLPVFLDQHERPLKDWPALRIADAAMVGPDLRVHAFFDRS